MCEWYHYKFKLQYWGNKWRKKYNWGNCWYSTKKCEITNNYNVSNIRGNDNSNYLAGIIGFSDSSLVKNCYNIGNIKGGDYAVNGILGNSNDNSNSIDNCYYLENTVNGKNGMTIISSNCIKNNSEMKKISELLGSEFKNDTQNINNGYPILNWQ